MKAPYPLSLDLPLGRSTVWLTLACVAHAASGLCVFFSAAGAWGLLVVPLLLGSFVKGVRQDYLRKTAASVCQLRFHAGGWRVLSGTGSWYAAELEGEQLITPFLTLLCVAIRDDQNLSCGKRYLVIFHDAADPELLRQLRVIVRFGVKS